MLITSAVSNKRTLLLWVVFCLGLVVFTKELRAISPPNGVAPVLVPTGGFAIDGNLLANNPTNGVGDWVTNAVGSGGGVLRANGTPLNTVTTFHLVDPYSSPSD